MNKKIFHYPKNDMMKLLAMLQEKYGKDFSEMVVKHIENGRYNKPEFLRELKSIYGNEVLEAVAELNGKKVFRAWRNRRRESDGTIDGLIKLLWKPLKKQGLEYTFTETEEGVLMNCTKCPYYDAAKTLGYEEEIYYMHCASDPYIVEGFNPNIGFKRTKTLMDGDCCDHFYYYKDKSK